MEIVVTVIAMAELALWMIKEGANVSRRCDGVQMVDSWSRSTRYPCFTDRAAEIGDSGMTRGQHIGIRCYVYWVPRPRDGLEDPSYLIYFY